MSFEDVSHNEGSNRARDLDIPPISIDGTSPELSEQAKETLQKQWEIFWKLRALPVSPIESNVAALESGVLLHNLRYDKNSLIAILKSGVISGELGYGEKSTRPEDAETHFCADFFVNQQDRSVQEYSEYAYGNEVNPGMLRRKKIESFSCPREQNDHIAIVIDPRRPELAELLQNSATGIDASVLADFHVRFPYDSERPDIAKRHCAVLVGLPANYISKMILGGQFASDQARVQMLKGAIADAGLRVPIVDWAGRQL